jgi:hypothetical protein
MVTDSHRPSITQQLTRHQHWPTTPTTTAFPSTRNTHDSVGFLIPVLASSQHQ